MAHERDLPLSVVDNVNTLDEEAQIELFNYFNQLRASGGILITSGNAAPTHMGLRDDLATRLAWGLVQPAHRSPADVLARQQAFGSEDLAQFLDNGHPVTLVRIRGPRRF